MMHSRSNNAKTPKNNGGNNNSNSTSASPETPKYVYAPLFSLYLCYALFSIFRQILFNLYALYIF
jgi:hypothetical protein